MLGCEKFAANNGMCKKHYARWYRNGSPYITKHASPGARGGIGSAGYRQVKGRNVHTTIAEAALGKPMPPKACVHHVDYNKLNNAHSNLVVCPNLAYHRLLHIRTNAINACGNASWRKCKFCGKYDAPASMYCYPGGNTFQHRKCFNAYTARRLAIRRMEEIFQSHAATNG